MAQKILHTCSSQNSWQHGPGLGGTGRASKSLRRSTAAPEEYEGENVWKCGAGGLVGGVSP